MSGLYRTVNPANDELIKEFATLDDAAAESLLQRSHVAFLKWRETGIDERIEAYQRFCELLEKHADDLARAASLEMGKPIGQSHAEVVFQAKAFMEFYAKNAHVLLAEQPIQAEGLGKAFSRREPVGVILGIGPWNGPYYQAMRVASPNLMLGNTVISKPAPICAGSTLLLDELFLDAGFPEGVHQTGLLSNEQVARFIADNRVRGITFTGSDATGKIIGGLAGSYLKPAILELGGSDAFLVLDSADPVEAAANASMCRMYISGQVCCSPKRLIVTDNLADQFIRSVCEAFKGLVVGDQFDEATGVGPLSSVEHAQKVQSQIQDAIDKGATVLVDGGWRGGKTAFFDPVVITGITPEMRIYDEEVFGPVAMIYRVADNDAALELANSSNYGLGGTVFAKDLDEAHRIANKLEVGMVGINGWLGGPVEVPFGGTKASGFGRELGLAGMDAFSNLKTYGQAG